MSRQACKSSVAKAGGRVIRRNPARVGRHGGPAGNPARAAPHACVRARTAAAWPPVRMAVSSGGVHRRDRLLDRAEDRLPRLVDHLDLHPVAVAHELGLRRAVLDRLEAALLGDAAVAALRILVRHRARADDRARAHVARLRRVRDQLTEVKHHVDARIRLTDLLAVPVDEHRAMQAAFAPVLAELVGRHGHRRERARRLALEEAEALRELGGNQVAQRHVVHERDEPHRFQRLVGRGAHRHVGRDHRDFRLEIDAPRLRCADDVVARAEEIVAAALVHQRIGPELGRHLGAARAAHELDVVHVRGAVRPLERARQRRHAIGGLERERVARAAVVQCVVQVAQLRRVERPVVEHALQRRRDRVGDRRRVQVARDDDQLAVARAVLERSKFHREMSRCSDDGRNLFYDGESARRPAPRAAPSPFFPPRREQVRLALLRRPRRRPRRRSRHRRGKSPLRHPVDRGRLSPARRADGRAARDDAARPRAARGDEPGEGAPLPRQFPAARARVAGSGVGPLRARRLRVADGPGAPRARRRREARAHRAHRAARSARPDGRHRGMGQPGADDRPLDGVEPSGEGVAQARRRDAAPRLGDGPRVRRVPAARQDGRDDRARARRHAARRALYRPAHARRSRRGARRRARASRGARRRHAAADDQRIRDAGVRRGRRARARDHRARPRGRVRHPLGRRGRHRAAHLRAEAVVRAWV
ncbi:hypothetical protein BURPS1710b_0601 [Burkholderia pseudomallei 1710b]|uniref:Uncharacterized protein n=1 Tax=Burkholderia pseudomallei (strain 1710b) TaxID=320372 RepID=Q3JWN8_BURP1|nr:hypothetical protein BURPS1710b_0601 [Burkholderia pseudomallei 1710b]